MASKKLRKATSLFTGLSFHFFSQENFSCRNITLPKMSRTNERNNKGEESIISSEIPLFANQVLYTWQAPCSLNYVLWFGLSYCQKGRRVPGKQHDLNNWSQALIPQLCCWLVHEDAERQQSSSKGQRWVQQMSRNSESHPCNNKQASGLGDGDAVCLCSHPEGNFRSIPGAKTKYSAMLPILYFEQAVGFVSQHLLIWIQREIQCVFISCQV